MHDLVFCGSKLAINNYHSSCRIPAVLHQSDSLYTICSDREHVCCNSGHSTRWSNVSSASLHSHFFMFCLLWPIFVQSLLMHFYFDFVPGAPLARDSLRVYISLWGTDCRWLYHSSICRVDGLLICSLVSCKKLLLDLRHLFGNVWPYSGCLVSFTCFSNFICASTPLFIAGW